ncbi:MAG: hypothetical protein WCL57_14420 [Chloroflexota bacterium]
MGNAQPGHVVKLADGDYVGPFTITNSGQANAPITLCGSRKAVLRNSSTINGSAILFLRANYWVLESFTFTHGKKGIFLEGANHNVLDGLAVHNIGDEGVRFKFNSSYNTLQNSQLWDIGTNVDNPNINNDGNGEGVYIGSSQIDGAPTNERDASDYNRILNNIIGPNVRSEAIDIKEGSLGGLIQGNYFDGHGTLLENSAGSWMDVKGNDYLIIYNQGKYARRPIDKDTGAPTTGGGMKCITKMTLAEIMCLQITMPI